MTSKTNYEMMVSPIPEIVLSSVFSALAGGAIYHLVANTLEGQRVKWGLLVELQRNYQTLEVAAEMVGDDNWEGMLHNYYHTRMFDSLETRTPKLRVKMKDGDELTHLYDELEYLNQLRTATLIERNPVKQSEILNIINNSQERIEGCFGKYKNLWIVGRNLTLETNE